VQAADLTTAQSSALFWINAAIGLVVAVTIFLGAGIVADFYGEPDITHACQAIAIVFLVNGLAVQHRAEITRQLRFAVLAGVDVSAQLCGAVVAIVCALRGLGLWSLVLQQIAVAVVTLLAVGATARWVPGLPRRAPGLRKFFAFGAATVGTQSVNYASSNIDSILMGRFWGAQELGVYGRSFQLFLLPLQQLVAPLTRVALPLLARTGDRQEFRRHLERAHTALLYAVLPVLALVAAAADDVIRVVLGDQWVEGAIYLQILLVGGAFQLMGYVYYWAFLARARMRQLLIYEGAGRIVMIALIVLAAPVDPVLIAVAHSVGLALIWGTTTAFGAGRVDLAPGRLLRLSIRPVVLASSVFLGAVAVTALLPDALPAAVVLVAAVVTAGAVVAAAGLVPGFRAEFSDLRRAVAVTWRGDPA
jgi:PST family polysaccharide transporter